MTGPANAAGSAPQAIHSRSVTFTGLSLLAAQVTFGAEQGEKVTFTVSNLSGPAPLGTVSVFATGNGSSIFLCSGTLTPLPGSLTFSAGSCGLGSSPLSPGATTSAQRTPETRLRVTSPQPPRRGHSRRPRDSHPSHLHLTAIRKGKGEP